MIAASSHPLVFWLMVSGVVVFGIGGFYLIYRFGRALFAKSEKKRLISEDGN